MTTLLAVGLIPLASTTVNAADNSVLNNYPYRKYITYQYGATTFYIVLCANTQINWMNAGSYDPFINPSLPLNYGEGINSYCWYINNSSGNYGFALVYNQIEWSVVSPTYSASRYTDYLFLYDDIGTSYDTKPSNFPEIDLGGVNIDAIKNEVMQEINSTTGVSTSAKNIQTQATNAYVDYSNGNITLTQLQNTIDSLASQLQDLNNNTSATLADKVAVNNAITQTQLVQDAANKDAIIQEMEEDLTVSSSVSSTITGKINQANQIFNQYSQGTTTQTEAVTQINQYITQLTQLITPQTPTADINAINAGINTINGIKDSLTKHSDLDDSVSESAQNSDKEELEYLENIEAETTENIDSLKSKVDNSISEAQASQVKNNVIAPILQNTLIVKVLPIAALFMVLAVTLGFKYRL